MPRFIGEFKRKGDSDDGFALNVGKKLLGYLSNQKRLSGVDSMVQRVTLQDGTTVEARFDQDVPSVRVIPADGSTGCELYVESGMLDLGPNIASDAALRFNRGVPQFGKEPATLYFGDGVDCEQKVAKFNGRIKVGKNKIDKAECLPSKGKSVESRLKSPKKKQAQAMLPASCWSGVMRRYIAAVYGGDSLKYELAGDTLVVDGQNVGGLGSSVGLIEIEGRHVFIFAGSDSITWSGIRFKGACGQAVYRLWQAKSGKVDQAISDKLLTIALSTAAPDPNKTGTLTELDGLSFLSAYGWQFSAAAPEAHAVVTDDDHNAILKKLTITKPPQGYAATVVDVESKPLPPIALACVISNPTGGVSQPAGPHDTGLMFGKTFDHPIHCYYENGGLVVVRYTVQTPEQVIETQEGFECATGVGGLPAMGAVTWATDAVPDAVNCGIQALLQFGSRLPPITQSPYALAMNKSRITTGLYALKDGASVWSSVRTTDICTAAFPRDNGMPFGDSSAYKWFFQGGLTVQLRTMNLGDASSIHVVYDSDDANHASEQYCPDLKTDDGLGGTPSKCRFSGPDFQSYDAIYSPCTGPVNYWSSIFDATNHTFLTDVIHITCTVPCRTVHAHEFYGEILLGPQNYLVLPRGDCAALVSVNLQAAGAHNGESLFADGYKVYSGKSCNQYKSSDCTGVLTAGCNGYDPVAGSYTHAEHFEDTYERVSASLPFYMSAQSADGFPVISPAYVDGSGPPNGRAFPHGDGDDAGPAWIKERLKSDWASVSVAGGKIGAPIARKGQFERVIEGSEIAWEQTEKPVTCPFWHGIVYADATLPPIKVAGKAGDTSVEKMYLDSPLFLMQREFTYVARSSLLGAQTSWRSVFDFGSSINMDREVITGGYTTVSTPSFVGWA